MILDKNLSIKKLTILTFIIMYSLFFIMTIINLYSYSRYEFSKNDKLIKNFIYGSNPLVIMICNSIILLLEGDILMTSYKK